MLKIGNFSKLSRMSIRTLRHYDELGLLKPVEVDSFTGYRYYRELQLLEAERIQCLRNMGFSLNLIREILQKYQDVQEMEHFLAIQRQELEQKSQEIEQKLRLIDSTIEWLRKDGTMRGYDVTLKTVPEFYAASVRRLIPTYADEGLLWKTMMEETAPLHIQYSNPSYAIAVFHDGEYKDNDVDVEVLQSVQGTYPDTEHVKFKTIPPVQIASAVFKGSYEQIGEVNAAVARWISDNGYEYDGLSFNIYHVSPGMTRNPDEYVTEVCYPVKKMGEEGSQNKNIKKNG